MTQFYGLAGPFCSNHLHFSASHNPVLTSPITSSYCILTIVLSRIFLKERFTKKQCYSIGLLPAGIIFLGIAEIFNI